MIDFSRSTQKGRLKRLVELENRIFNCKQCLGLNIEDKTMSAPGYGSVGSELMCVGQSLHSYNKDTPKVQIPFVGPVKSRDSGVMLYKALSYAGYTPDKRNLYMTNVVHCHPPNNRPSKQEEKNNCKDFLSEEIALVRPKIILCIGKDAKAWFGLDIAIQGFAIVKDLVYRTRNMVYVLAVHPSYILRYSSELRFKYIVELTDKLLEAKEIINHVT